MKLTVLGSNSSGNCYLLENEKECLVLECGIPFKEVKKALGFDILKIVGVVGSHSHLDHMGFAGDYLKCGIPVYASEETLKMPSIKKYENKVIMRVGFWHQIGGFNVTPFRVEHDVECYGFIIRHEDFGSILFATDTAYISQNFKKLNLNHILIEANYSNEIINKWLELGEIDQARVNRTFKTHMEIQTTRDFVTANITPMLDSVLLLHLSEGNANPEEFQRTIQGVVGDKVAVRIADKGLCYSLNTCPF